MPKNSLQKLIDRAIESTGDKAEDFLVIAHDISLDAKHKSGTSEGIRLFGDDTLSDFYELVSNTVKDVSGKSRMKFHEYVEDSNFNINIFLQELKDRAEA